MNATSLVSRRTALSLALLSLFAYPAHAQSNGGAAQDPAADSAASKATQAIRSVMVVGKRGQTAATTAAGLSVVSGDALEKMGAQTFEDYLGRLPGVVFNAGQSGNSTAVIRGVGTTAGLDQGQGTTGYYINEIPLSEVGYTISIPDIDNFDVSRVEVLRGPQGSLYGASSLGGAINYVAKEADTAGGFDAALETSLSKTANANKLGYTGKAMLNIPLVANQLAARVVAVQRETPGYLDNIGLKKGGSNSQRTTDGRVSLVWTPGDKTRVSLLALGQKSFADDASFRMTKHGELARSTEIPASFDLDFALYSARVDHDFGGAKLTAIASFNRKHQELHFDDTLYYQDFGGTSGAQLFRQLGTSRNTNLEARLASPTGGRFEWIVGAALEKTNKRFDEDLSAVGANAVLTPQYGAAALRGDYYYWGWGDTHGTDKSVFGEASVNFGSWKLTAGGRKYITSLDTAGYRDGVFYPGGSYLPDGHMGESGFSPKISVSYKTSPQTMYYALASEGFRFGGTNILLPMAGFETPNGYGSDTLRNYELGVKSSLLDRRLSFEADVFDIEWSDLQVRLVRPDNMTYATNAGKARLRGLEFSGSYRATEDLSLGMNYTYLDAKLTEDLLQATVPLRKGQRLPGSSKNQLSANATYTWSASPYRPSATLSGRYLSDAPANLQQADQRINGFSQLDARYAMNFGNLEFSLYVNNLTDKRGVTFSYGNDDLFGQQQFLIRPRTIGARLHWEL